jgi:hypothetical protein
MRLLSICLLLLTSQLLYGQVIDPNNYEPNFEEFIVKHSFENPEIIYASHQNEFEKYKGDSLMIYSIHIPFDFTNLPILKSPMKEKLDTIIILKHNDNDAVYFENTLDSSYIFAYYFGDNVQTFSISGKSKNKIRNHTRQLFNQLIASFMDYNPKQNSTFDKLGITFDYQRFDLRIEKGIIPNSVTFTHNNDKEKFSLLCGEVMPAEIESSKEYLTEDPVNGEYIRMIDEGKIKARLETVENVSSLVSLIECKEKLYFIYLMTPTKSEETIKTLYQILDEIKCK